MEWGRAKTILLVAFLLLNVLLAFQLRETSQSMAVQNVAMEEFSEEVRGLMARKNITIESAMPAVAGTMEQITVTFQNDSLSGRLLKLEKPLAAGLNPNSDEFRDALQRQVSGLKMANYQFDRHNKEEDVILFHQLYEGLPMFEVNLRLYREGGKVVGLQRDEVKIEAAEEQTVISSYTALSTLVENFLPDGSRVEGVEIGYHGQIFNSDKQFLSPFWRVTLNDGAIYFVHAITGAVEVQQKEPVK